MLFVTKNNFVIETTYIIGMNPNLTGNLEYGTVYFNHPGLEFLALPREDFNELCEHVKSYWIPRVDPEIGDSIKFSMPPRFHKCETCGLLQTKIEPEMDC